jgi:FkbM family methyltransferase
MSLIAKVAENVPLPILRGGLRGKWWLLGSRGKLLRVLLSTYEREQTALFRREVRSGHVVFDVGAHAGYYTLLASALVGPTGKVFAFEPESRNYRMLEKQVAINRCSNVALSPSAVSDSNGFARFARGTGSGTGHLSDSGAFSVPVLRLDEFAAEQGVTPTHVKIDVEGAEMQVLAGARELLASARPILFLSTHGPDIHAQCCLHLENIGYTLQPMRGTSLSAATGIAGYPR